MHRASIFISVVLALSVLGLDRTWSIAAETGTPMADQQGFVGSWRVTVSPAQRPPFLGLVTFGADGTAVTSPPPVLPQPEAPDEVMITSAGHGAWTMTGSDKAVLTFVVLAASEAGKPLGTNTVRVRATLGPEGQTFSGEGVATFANPAGDVVATVPLTVRATRIAAEAPEMPAIATPSA